jgi:NAD(P)-dependent dehydrogenase (short-subunit alcohol dehydrogenase family)
VNGSVVLFGRGGDVLRAVTLAVAGAGRPIGLATITTASDDEFATASIANELWVLGVDHLHRVLDSADPVAVTGFLAEVEDCLGPLGACIIDPGPIPPIPFDGFSIDEWLPLARVHLQAALVIARAATPLLERRGGGTFVLVQHPQPGTAATCALWAALQSLPAALEAEHRGRPLRFRMLEAPTAAGILPVLTA